MKKSIALLVPLLMIVASAYAVGGRVTPNPPADTMIDIVTDVDTTQLQQVSVIGGGDSSSESSSYATGGDADSSSTSSSTATGGDADSTSDASSTSGASVSTTSISNYETRTQPLSVFPPYLPYWNHGGWGTIKAYFPNGPNSDDQVYERTFDPSDPQDMKELRGVLTSLSYDGPLGVIGGVLNGVGAVFGGADNFHHGRGFEIANALARVRRPKGKPLFVFIDSSVSRNLLRDAGYAYVGKVSLEGKVNRNWDHVYDAAVAETLPWDVDILLLSGGMKGVTVGSNISFPGASGAYSQVNHSVSLFGSVSGGITEGKGKAVVSGEGYRYAPAAVQKRRIPQSFYGLLQARTTPRSQPQIQPRREPRPRPAQPGRRVPRTGQPARTTRQQRIRGVEVSRRLYEMAGFDRNQTVENVTIR